MSLTEEIMRAALSADDHQRQAALRALRGENPESEPAVEPYLTLKQLAKILNFHPSTLWRWNIPKHELGGRPRFLASEVVAYLNSAEFKLRAQQARLQRRASR